MKTEEAERLGGSRRAEHLIMGGGAGNRGGATGGGERMAMKKKEPQKEGEEQHVRSMPLPGYPSPRLCHVPEVAYSQAADEAPA